MSALLDAPCPNAAEMLWRTAATHPDRPAIVEHRRTITFRELVARAAAIADSLGAERLPPGARVGILLDRGADAAAAFYGTLGAGLVAVNINETLRTRQVDHVLEHSGASVLLTSAEVLGRLPRPPKPGMTQLLVEHLGESGMSSPRLRTGDDVAHIIYTSGSTGLPKGVTISHHNLWSGMWAVARYLHIGPADRIASLLPFSFDYGLNQLLLAAGTGACLVVERSPLPQEIVATLAREQVTVLPCVPPLWLQLLATEAFRTRSLPSLRVMTNTGGRIPVDAVRALRAAQPQAELFLMYGLTEAFRSTYLPPDEVDRRPESIGKAIPGAEILVLRDDGTPCEAGEVGELVHRGPTVALGYWNDPEATARVFRPAACGPTGARSAQLEVFSGDLVRKDEEGFLYHVGRRDKMIKSMGYRVSPDEVVSLLFASGEVTEAAVAAVPDQWRGELIVAHVVLAPCGSLERLRIFCGQEMPRYLQPGRFEIHDALPRTSSGKHDIAALTASQNSECALIRQHKQEQNGVRA